jgi:hypothetical protein
VSKVQILVTGCAGFIGSHLADVFNTAGAEIVSMNEPIRLVEELVGCPIQVEHVAAKAGDVRYTGVDLTKCRGKLGYSPRFGLVEGLRAQIDTMERFKPLHRHKHLRYVTLPQFSRFIIENVNRLTIVGAALGLSVIVLTGCKRDIQNNEAVRQGVQAYLAKRSDLLAMDVSVTSVKYNNNEATARVHFQAKGNAAPGSGMDMQYVLDRKGNQWVVRARAASETHGSQGMPQGAPQDGSGSIGAMPQTLPPGHPAIKRDKQPGPPK